VVCHDILGQTALVDLAGLRDAIADQGGDPAKVNPVVPVQLIVDHSLAVECGGFDPEAFEKNRAIEDRRNEDRFHFIDWTKQAFENVDVIPAGNGIMHQINLEKMSPVIYVQRRRGLSGHLRRHRQPHAARGCAGRDRHRRRRPGGRERDAGPRVVDAPAGHRRRRTHRQAQPGITATDMVLASPNSCASKVVGAYLEFYGEGAAALTARRPRDDLQHGAGIRRHRGDVLHRPADLDYLRLTGREDEQVKLVETYAKAAGLWADA
jgi:aconitase A